MRISDLADINCTPHHYAIVKGLTPAFAILSLIGIGVWWFAWPLCAAMSADSFVVIFRRRKCINDKFWTNLALVSSVLNFFCSMACFVSLVIIARKRDYSNRSVFNIDELNHIFYIVGGIVYPVWFAHYIIVLCTLEKMKTWMKFSLGLA